MSKPHLWQQCSDGRTKFRKRDKAVKMRSKLAVLLLLLPLKGASCMETELTEEESQITVEQIQGVIGMGSTPADVIVRWLQCTITLVFASDVQVEFHSL